MISEILAENYRQVNAYSSYEEFLEKPADNADLYLLDKNMGSFNMDLIGFLNETSIDFCDKNAYCISSYFMDGAEQKLFKKFGLKMLPKPFNIDFIETL